MSIKTHKIIVDDLPVQIVRKAIKNLHLGVYPPHGRVRVAVPFRVTDDSVRLAVVGKLGWIKRQRAKFEAQPRQSLREMVSGESHYFLGQRYRLRVFEHNHPAEVEMRNKSIIELHVRPKSTAEQRERILHRWYRQQLKQMIPAFLEKWQPILGVQVADWGIKKMKTRWGTCNPDAHRIWLNLELAKKPTRCLEYVVVHEMAHLIRRHHDDQFLAIMNRHIPQWQSYRQELNSSPLGHETWIY
jgi:predicted metal-dependent hydrolase